MNKNDLKALKMKNRDFLEKKESLIYRRILK